MEAKLSFQIKKHSIINTKYFVYKGNKYPVDFDSLVKSCSYFHDNKQKYEKTENIDLTNKISENVNLTEESIRTFISSCQNEPCEISQSSIISLQYLSRKFKYPELIKITDEIIKEHWEELVIPIFIFKCFTKQPQNDDETFFDTSKEEAFISTHLNECLSKKEEMLSIPIPILHRIFKKYFDSNGKVTSEMTEFMFECLEKKGIEASVLFNNVDFGERKVSVVSRLIEKYSDKFDFNMINSTLVKTTKESTSDMMNQKEEEYSKLFTEMKKSLEEQRKELEALREEIRKNQENSEDKQRKQKEEMEKMKNEVSESMKIIEDKFSKMCNKQENIIEEDIVKKYQRIILKTIKEEEYNKLEEDLKDHIISEVIKDPTEEKLTQNNLVSKILHLKLYFDLRSPKEDNIQAIKFIKENMSKNYENEELIISITDVQNLNKKGMLQQCLIKLMDNCEEFTVTLEYPSNEFVKIMNDLSYIKNKDPSQASLMKISLEIKESSYFAQNYEFNQNIDICIVKQIPNKIDKPLFNNFNKLSALKLSEGITAIEPHLFKGCASLQHLSISTAVTSIGKCAFKNCTSLKEISIPASVTSIGKCAFKNCTSLKEISIPASVSFLGEFCFEGCANLEQFLIDPFRTPIKQNTFNNCQKLRYLTIPSSSNSVSKSNGKAFIPSFMTENLIKSELLNSSEISSANNYSEVEIEIEYPSWNFDQIYQKVLELKQANSKVKIRIFYTGMSTADDHFAKNNDINYVRFDTSVKKTNNGSHTAGGSFQNCSSLIEVFIPSSFTNIGNYTFCGCSFQRVTFEEPSSLNFIGEFAFYCCLQLKQISIPSSVTGIGDFAFANCSQLKQISIPSSVTYIGRNAFYCCQSLKQISIPSSVTYIGQNAFQSCSQLRRISIPSRLDPRDLGIGDISFLEIIRT